MSNGSERVPERPVFVGGVDGLKAEIAALKAENEKLRERLSWIEQQDAGLRDDIGKLEAERDALQAQLDNMTTEVRAVTLRVNERGRAEVGPLRWMKRLVGPWVEAEGDNTND